MALRVRTLDDFPTKTCPWPGCGRRVNQRKGGCCPHCGGHLDSLRVPNAGPYAEGEGKHRTVWVQNGTSTGDLVKMLRSYIRTEISNPQFEFAEWGRECGQAGILLGFCGGEADVAEGVLEAFFDPDLRSRLGIWQSIRSMAHVVSPRGCINQALSWSKQKYGTVRPIPIEQAGL